ncbi:hypothetical protein [Nocardia sp. NPDC127526]|uniref:primosomal protein N' family DNA-binding protein n=1 Tax=Nocardia sp. NPDC127526 TaxID=3345393 RepID=UPI00363904EF
MAHTEPAAASHPIARVLPLLEPAHLDRDFDYLVPPEMNSDAQPGVRVRVRFSGRLVDGYLLERLETTPHTGKLMPLDRVVSPERVLTPEILRLITAVASRYAGTRADVLRLAIPPRHAKVESEGRPKPPAKPKSRRKKPTGNTEIQAVPPTPASDPLAPEDPSPASSAATAPDPADAPSHDTPAVGSGIAAERVSPESIGSEEAGGAAATAAQVPASTEDHAPRDDSVAHEPAAGSDVDARPLAHSGDGGAAPTEGNTRDGATEGAAERLLRANLARESDVVAGDVRGAVAGTTDSADMRQRAAEAGLVVDVTATGRVTATPASDMPLTGENPASPAVVSAATDRSPDGTADGRGSGADGDELGGADAAGGGGAPAGASETPDSEVAVSNARPEDFPAWGRYVHGMSFLGALAAGRGPRAAWQALPGEDWARRLAEMAAVVAEGGRSAVLMVPDQRDLDRVLGECVALVGESAVGLAAGLGPSARYRRWLAALRGTARVVIGTRSSVFAPVKDLGLIAIWDDGDDTYAEPRAPYPHAREVAMLRAHETGAAFVAGGFARTAEVQAIVESGWAHDLLADRADLRAAMPRIKAPGDTDVALERDPIAKAVRIPGEAFMAAKRALAEGAPVLVQVPRRGYIPALSCAKCRTPARCRHCNGPLALPDNGSKTGSATSPGGNGARAGGDGARRSAQEVGVAASVARGGAEVAHSPTCRWCGKTEPAFRCGACGSRALRAVVIGAARTAEELGRAFPGVPVRGSGGGNVLSEVPPGPQVVVATIGAEPTVPGGYGVALLLDGWALLGRADLRAAEDTLRRWMSATALVRPKGQALVMAEPTLPTVQALLRWDPVWHAQIELSGRTEVRFPPAVRLAAIDGTTDSIAELLTEAKLPDFVEVLGPVPLPFGARKPFSGGDSPAEVERMILRVDRSAGSALARALTAAQAVRSTHKSDDPLRVQIDPIDIG